MAQAEKENWPENWPLQQTPRDQRRKEGPFPVSSTLSNSRIPVPFRSSIPAELKQSQQQSQLRHAPPSSPKSKGVKNSRIPPIVSAPGVAVLEQTAGLLPKSLSREPLGEMQLCTSGHRNNDTLSVCKEVSTVEFVPDVAALASILSNTGLPNHMVSATHKPSLAGQVPLRGSRACSTSIGMARTSVCKGAPIVHPPPMVHVSRSTLKADTDQPRSCSLALTTQQLKALSATFKTFDSQMETAKPSQSTEDQGESKCHDSGTRPNPEHLSSVLKTGVPTQSDLIEKDAAESSSSKEEEEFVPDPAAKASILSNVGLCRFALGANGKLSLAQRVPLKDARKNSSVSGSAKKGEEVFSRGPCARVSSIGKFGRVSCRSTQGLKGLGKSEDSETEITNTPGRRCLIVDSSPFGLARRVPLTCPPSSRRPPWTFSHATPSSRPKSRRGAAQPVIEKQQGTLTSSVPPGVASAGTKEDDSPTSWGKIAVRLFDDESAALVKTAPAVPVITQEMGKLQRIELLAQLLEQEMNSSVDPDIATSVEKLHKLLSARSSSSMEASQPGLTCTPLQDPRSDVCRLAPSVMVPSEPGTILTTTISQQSVCPSPSLSSTSSLDQIKNRPSEVLRARQDFREACLNDECAFYASHVPSASKPPIQRCKEPVAKMLDVLDTMRFIPISACQSPSMEAKRTWLS